MVDQTHPQTYFYQKGISASLIWEFPIQLGSSTSSTSWGPSH